MALRLGRVAVAGHSMAPALRDGDRLVYSPLRRSPRAGDIVIAIDPRDERRWIVKRVGAVDGGHVSLRGDVPGHDAPAVDAARLVGRALFRYWPIRRIGFL